MNIKWTAPKIRALKGRGRFATLTAYDFVSARLLDEAGLPLILVGDSLGNTVLGYDSTLPVTLDDIVHHTAAVARGVKQAMVIADLPFMTYQVSPAQALKSAGRCLQEGGADGVKIEGGAFRAPTVRALVRNGIPVVGHIGLLPQNVRAMGGYKVQGRTAAEADALREDALALAEAGVFAMVLEGIPAAVAGAITAAVPVPTIGIGAGPQCDAQILVWHDLLGLGGDKTPKFVKRYADLAGATRQAISAYKAEVESGTFPGQEHCY